MMQHADASPGLRNRRAAIRQLALRAGNTAAGRLSGAEALALIDWAAESDSPAEKAELLDLYRQLGGAESLRDALRESAGSRGRDGCEKP